MTCKSVRQQLDAYTLGELDLPSERAVTSHLEFCPLCAAVALESRRDIAAVSTALKTDLMAPPDMLDRFQVRLVQRRSRPSVPYRHLAIACVVAAAAIACALLWPRPDSAVVAHGQPLSSLAVAVLPAPNPAMTPVRALIAFRRESGIAMIQPNIAAIGGKYLGASCAQIGRSGGLALRYRVGDKIVTFMQVPSTAVSVEGSAGVCGGKRHYYLAARDQTSIVAWISGNTTCALVAPIEEEKLLEMAKKIE